MSKYSKAIDDLERFAVMLQGVPEAARMLRELDSFEGTRDSLIAEAEKLKPLLAKAHADLAKTKEEAATVKAAADRWVEDARTGADQLIAKAKADAARLAQEAAEQAALDLDADKKNREAMLASVTKQIAEASKKLKDLQEANAKATQAAEAIERRAAAAQASLEKVQADARLITGGA